MDVLTQHETPSDAERDPALSSERIEAALQAVLASPPFRHTQQCSSFLLYVVKHTLAGEDNLLRERVIGSEVFHRAPGYETGEDPVVRLRASEVRKRLAQYYQSAVTDVVIEIPSGSYRASFRLREPGMAPRHSPASQEPATSLSLEAAQNATSLAVEPISSPPLAPEISVAPPISRRKHFRPLALLALLMIGVSIWAAVAMRSSATIVHEFWKPWLGGRKPVLIALGSNAVYRVSDSFADAYGRTHGGETLGAEIAIPQNELGAAGDKDLYLALNSFIALGDVAANSSIVSVLAAEGQPFQQRFPNDISFAELRDSPTVLIGGFNNPIGMELTKKLRFRLASRNEISDGQNPAQKWVLHASSDSHDTEDYAIVTRIVSRNGEAPLLAVAGMGQYGTQAAADFVCSPALLAQLSHKIGSDWKTKNFQIVLHVKVLDFKPGSPDIVSAYSW